MKLIKLSNEYYLISTKKANVGDYQYNGYNINTCTKSGQYPKLIASTQNINGLPLLDRKKEIKYQKCVQNCFEALSGKCICPSRMIALDELVCGVNIENLANKWALDNAEETMATNSALNKGFKGGFNSCVRLNEDKKFTLDDMNKLSVEIWEWINTDKYGAKQNLESVTNNFIQSITKDQYQWEVDIEENTESVVMGGLRSVEDFGGPGPQNYDYSTPIVIGGYINITRIK